jgi:AraC-like DNA-binding protein
LTGAIEVLGGHFFRRVGRLQPAATAQLKPTAEALLALLSPVVDRFRRLADTEMIAVPVALSEPPDAEEPPAGPCHPACAEHVDSDYCRESWQLHLAELKDRPETHWHQCDQGRLCALVPVVCRGRCLAAIKLACPASAGETDFQCQVELMDLLVKEFMASEADFLEQMLRDEPAASSRPASPSQSVLDPPRQPPSHPQVLRAVQHIEEHLSDPGMTVRRIARELGINPNYLSQLFVEQVGQRMSRFIAAHRVELAKTLLATTDWQVKRIAHETGHANPNWFCHVFGVHTGLTPGEYRKASRDQSSAPLCRPENPGTH